MTNLADNIPENSLFNLKGLMDNDELCTSLDHEMQLCGETALWQSVIMQAVLDILNCSKRTSERMERGKAISWFSLNNEDFLMVCSMASLDPKFVIKNVGKILKEFKPNHYRTLTRQKRSQILASRMVSSLKKRQRAAQ